MTDERDHDLDPASDDEEPTGTPDDDEAPTEPMDGAGGPSDTGSSDRDSSGVEIAEERPVIGGRDEAAIARMRRVAYLLDDSVPLPGTPFRIGIDPILGVLPVSGDLVSAGLSLYIVAESARLGVSTPTLLRMGVNVGLDVAGGSVPVLGTLFDAAWKANKRNVELALDELEAEVAEPEAEPDPGHPTEAG